MPVYYNGKRDDVALKNDKDILKKYIDVLLLAWIDWRAHGFKRLQVVYEASW